LPEGTVRRLLSAQGKVRKLLAGGRGASASEE
jgi:hypothetical protein